MKKSLIKFLLGEAEITQDEIAVHLEVSSSTVSQVICGQCKSQRIERAVAKAIGVPVQDVFPSRYNEHGEIVPYRRRKMKTNYDALVSKYSAACALARVAA